MMSEVTIDWLIDDVASYAHRSIKVRKSENKWDSDISFPIYYVDNECRTSRFNSRLSCFPDNSRA